MDSKKKQIQKYQNRLLKIFKKIKNKDNNIREYRSKIMDIIKELKEYLGEKHREGDEDTEIFDIAIILWQVFKNLNYEKLSHEQMEVITKTVKRLTENVNENDCNDIIEKIIKVGLYPFVKFSGLAEIYKEQGVI